MNTGAKEQLLFEAPRGKRQTIRNSEVCVCVCVYLPSERCILICFLTSNCVCYAFVRVCSWSGSTGPAGPVFWDPAVMEYGRHTATSPTSTLRRSPETKHCSQPVTTSAFSNCSATLFEYDRVAGSVSDGMIIRSTKDKHEEVTFFPPLSGSVRSF